MEVSDGEKNDDSVQNREHGTIEPGAHLILAFFA